MERIIFAQSYIASSRYHYANIEEPDVTYFPLLKGLAFLGGIIRDGAVLAGLEANLV